MSKLVEMEIKDYLELLSSKSPAPGGGSASALAGAQGVALVMMVAELTVGKEKYSDWEEGCKEAIAEGTTILQDFVEVIDEDTRAYTKVMDAFKLPKESDEEKTARRRAIDEATITSTKVPLETMKIAMRGIALAEKLIGKSNPNCASDIGVGALNLKAALEGAWLNVKINLPGIKDENLAKELFCEGENLLKDGGMRAEECYREIERTI